ncbi:MAG: ATP phosphoribosyltransferase regulatory subunit [Sphingomonadaceae bacterium]|nr:ATP phosphoribosyltransferase regulatory subunit [Sphingomonadaceae bacterium]
MTPITAGLLPEGYRDRLPPQADAADRLLRTLIDHVAAHGYDRVQPPLVEYEDGLAGRLATTARQELLRFVDPVSRLSLALRPDITGQVGRIAATRLAHVPRPLRLGYGGPVLRVHGSQLRPEREMLQAGAELIGRDSVAAVVEVLTLAIGGLRAAGVAAITVDLTLPSFVADLAAHWAGPAPIAGVARVEALLDAKDAAGLAAAGASIYAPLIAAAGPASTALAALAALDLPAPLTARLTEVAAVVASVAVAHPQVAVTLDPTERHGFDYQRWIGFTLFADRVRGEIGRGGAYSVVHPDGTTEPAVGFSLYLDGLVDAGLGVATPRRIALPAGTSREVGERLRADGWITVAALAADDPERGCSHYWDGTAPVEIARG